MSKEYLEREAVIGFLENMAASRYLIQCFESKEKFPAADVAEVRHGEWVHSDLAATWYGKDECSECHYHTADRVDLSCFNYCPDCGAKMNRKGEGE